jgi:ABC-2 type transport system ATP-binding protein
MSDTSGRQRPASETTTVSTAQEADRPPVVAVEGLQKTYGDDVRALDGVSFGVRPGEVVGLLGPNGAGKTTCIKCLLGLVEPSGGTVEVASVDAQANPRAAYGRVGAMLEGARNVYWRLTVRENLEFFAGIAGNAPSEVRDRHDELLERLTLAEKADEPVRDLSRGMKQKVSLATTLARDVDVVFLDEPTLGLDVESSLELRRELATLATERDLAVVLSSHDMDVIQDLCDRVVVLSDGEIVADDSVDALLDLFRTQTYEISFETPADTDVVSRLRQTCEVTDVSHHSTRTVVTVQLEDGNELPRVTGEVVDAGGQLHGVDTVEPDLEEAFLRITGGEMS